MLPIKVNDVLHVRMRVGAMRPSNSRPGWGIVVLPSELINQHGEVVQRGEHRLMVPVESAGMSRIAIGGYPRHRLQPLLAGPYVGRCTAALGAEVIKVERPGSGDAGRQHAFTPDEQQSGYFLQLNMGKQGVSVNMKDPRGKAFMQRLTDSADVFIENYRPGATGQTGLGYAELSARNPRLVYCSISAYGHTGPDAHRAGFGLIAEAKSGIMQMVGVPGEAPPLLRISLGRHVHRHPCRGGDQCGATGPGEQWSWPAHRHGPVRHAGVDA